MKNFIFKSEADFHKIVFNKLDALLGEQRKQRQDLSTIMRMLQTQINSLNLQKQVDEYFEDESGPDTPPNLPLEDSTKHIPEE